MHHRLYSRLPPKIAVEPLQGCKCNKFYATLKSASATLLPGEPLILESRTCLARVTALFTFFNIFQALNYFLEYFTITYKFVFHLKTIFFQVIAYLSLPVKGLNDFYFSFLVIFQVYLKNKTKTKRNVQLCKY